ncbi:MAG: hypothetical protein ACP6IT_08085, partial [Candidatus Thorarchaeota archaeon]
MRRRLLIVVLFIALFALPVVLLGQISPTGAVGNSTNEENDTRTVDLGDGTSVKLGPNEELHRFVLTEQGWVEWEGTSDSLTGGEYGNRSDVIQDRTMRYYANGTTSGVGVDIPTGEGWEAYHVEAVISDLTENRTWVKNPDFSTNIGTNNWTEGTVDTGSNSHPLVSYNSTGDASGGGCIDLEIYSSSSGPTYWYDADDFAYVSQTMTIDRGSVIWAGLRLDYWADTQDDTHYGMTGSYALYAKVEGTTVWQIVFDDIGAEEQWFDSGLISVPTSIFSLTSVDIEVGLWSKQNVGYEPDIAPRAKIDNVVLYVKTLA